MDSVYDFAFEARNTACVHRSNDFLRSASVRSLLGWRTSRAKQMPGERPN